MKQIYPEKIISTHTPSGVHWYLVHSQALHISKTDTPIHSGAIVFVALVISYGFHYFDSMKGRKKW